MAKASKKLTIVSLVVLPAILGGCFLAPQGQNTNQPVNANNTNQAVNTNQGGQGEIDTSDLPSEDLSQEGWKTYRNEEYGFEFEYPRYFQVINNSDKFINGTLLDLCPIEDESSCKYRISGYYLIVEDTEFSDFANFDYQYTNDPESIVKESIINIGGGKGKLVEVMGSVKGKIYWIQIIKNNKLYTFKIDEYLAENYNKQKMVLDKIISTFSFK